VDDTLQVMALGEELQVIVEEILYGTGFGEALMVDVGALMFTVTDWFAVVGGVPAPLQDIEYTELAMRRPVDFPVLLERPVAQLELVGEDTVQESASV
jgi:hypothetical protein